MCAIDPAATYSVTVNSFLGTGGDNFFELANGANKVDTGKIDLAAMVDFMAQYPEGSPLEVDYSQRAVEVEFPGAAPEAYAPGDTVEFDVASWTMSNASDVKDTAIQVKLGDEVLGTATLNNTIGNKPYDNYGTAHGQRRPAGGAHQRRARPDPGRRQHRHRDPGDDLRRAGDDRGSDSGYE